MSQFSIKIKGHGSRGGSGNHQDQDEQRAPAPLDPQAHVVQLLSSRG
jgi:hypothetical protein